MACEGVSGKRGERDERRGRMCEKWGGGWDGSGPSQEKGVQKKFMEGKSSALLSPPQPS
jgi:hypothetical protein